MLVLSRTFGEAFMIGDNLKLTIRELDDAHVSFVISQREAVDLAFEKRATHRLKCGEAVQIADGIVCNVIMIDRGKVRLGFKCPPTVRIDRAEIYELNRAKRQKAAR